jgi:hypothetical protein
MPEWMIPDHGDLRSGWMAGIDKYIVLVVAYFIVLGRTGSAVFQRRADMNLAKKRRTITLSSYV